MEDVVTPDVAAPPEGTPPSVQPPDPFALDEARFASLSPEQRAAIDPVLNDWKQRATEEIEKRGKTYEEKYKPHREKAEALEGLVKDPRFQQWWTSITRQANAVNPAGSPATNQARPQDFASEQEWQEAVISASNGDSTKLREIQARMWSVMATPIVQQLKAGQDELRTTLEMKDLFERHADAKELDLVGRDPNDPDDKNLSLLEMGLNWATENRKSLEEGYKMAKRWADSIRVGAKQEAMGLLQDKKSSVTSGPSTNKGGQAVVEVEDLDELMTKRMEAQLSGGPVPRFVIRSPQNAENQGRWAQKT